MQTKKETWHTKCLSFEVEVQLFKEQSRTPCELVKYMRRLYQEKYNLEEWIKLKGAKEKAIATQREIEVKQDVETTKWKALTLEQSTKAIHFDQLLEKQGEELFAVLIETQLSMV